MNLDGLGSAGWWLLAALLLGAAELVAPGVFLVFAALAAGATAAILLAVPDLPVAGQLLSFAAWSAVAVLVGRRWYADYPVPSDDAFLNDRAARLIGQVVTVVEAIEHGRGRVRVADSVWLARGPETPAGDRVRVLDVDGAMLVVEEVPSPSSGGEGLRA